ncbi:hypothetical protein C8R43DRAFT_835832, partial [Mycena crocata]
MKMPLPAGIPTLCAKRTGNLTRPDNVFCSEDFLAFFVSCDAYPARTPGTTDHFPVISELDLEPPSKEKEERWNWRGGKWKEFGEMLEAELEAVGEVDGYASVEEVLAGIEELDAAVWRCVREHIPLAKVCPHSKRWWTPELSEARKVKQRLALKSYRRRDNRNDPIHEEFRVARNSFSAKIKAARDNCFLEWTEQIDGSDVWTAGQMMKGPPTD